MKITNNSQQPQGVHGPDGLVFIQPGQSREVALSERSFKAASELSFLTIEGKPEPDDKPVEQKAPAAPATAKTAAAPSGELAALRKDYKAAFGKGPSPKWDAATIKAKIAEKAGGEQKSFDDMSDTELKTFLGEKGVSVTDETRDQLIELAKAA